MAQTTTRIYKTVVLEPGESFTIPPDGEVVFISNSTGIDSLCPIPPLEEYVCYKMDFGVSDTEGEDAALEDEGSPHPTIQHITISGTDYIIGFDLNGAQLIPLITTIEASVPPAIFQIYSGYKENHDRRREFGLKFRTFPSLAEGMEMKITGLSYIDGLYVKAVLDTDCDCFTTQDDIYCPATPNT